VQREFATPEFDEEVLFMLEAESQAEEDEFLEGFEQN